MISVDLAERLRDAGLAWSPAAGDRFVVPDRDLDDDVFVVSDMVVEVHDRPTGRIIGFNGTTEWALDSVETDAVVWLPREEQLRAWLGPRFRALQAQSDGFVVVIEHEGVEQRHADLDPEGAYARALLATLAG